MSVFQDVLGEAAAVALDEFSEEWLAGGGRIIGLDCEPSPVAIGDVVTSSVPVVEQVVPETKPCIKDLTKTLAKSVSIVGMKVQRYGCLVKKLKVLEERKVKARRELFKVEEEMGDLYDLFHGMYHELSTTTFGASTDAINVILSLKESMEKK